MFFRRCSRPLHSPCADRSAKARFADLFRRSRLPAFCHRAGLRRPSRVHIVHCGRRTNQTTKKIGRVVLVLANVFPCPDGGLTVRCEKLGPWVGSAGDKISNQDGRERSQGHAIAGKSCRNELMRRDFSDIRKAVRGFEHLAGPAVARLRPGKDLRQNAAQFLVTVLGIFFLACLVILATEDQRSCPFALVESQRKGKGRSCPKRVIPPWVALLPLARKWNKPPAWFERGQRERYPALLEWAHAWRRRRHRSLWCPSFGSQLMLVAVDITPACS